MTITRREFGILAGGMAGAALLPRLASAGTASHGISAFGDLKYGPDFTHFDYANPNAPKGGLWSTGYGNVTFDSMNPFILKGNSAIGMSLIWDSLMVGSGDEADSRYGLIAESGELGDGRAWVAFNLRPEARFHDGSPITSEDVVFSFNTLKEKGHPSYRVLYAPVISARAEGPERVVFEFDPTAPKRDLPMMMAGLTVISKAYYTANDFTESSLEVPLGNGAYQVGRFETGQWMEFDRVKDYWAADLPVNKGRHNFDTLRFEYYRDRTAQFEGFKGGGFMFNEEFWSKLWATAYTEDNIPPLKTGEIVKETLPDERPAGSQGYWFNLRRPKFQDQRVREAIAIGFDFEWSNDKLFFGLYNRTDSFFEGGPMQAGGTPTPGELAILEKFANQLPDDMLTAEAYIPPVTDGSGRNRRALRAAGKLLQDAGWDVVDGKRQKDGEVLSIEFLNSGVGFERITNPFFKNLERLGIETSIRTVDAAQYKKREEDYDFDIIVDRKSMSLTPGVELRDYFHSGSANSPGSDNLAGLEDPVVDAILDIIERADSRETLTDAVKALDRVLRAKHIWIPQWNKASHTIAYWNMYDRPAIKPKFARGIIDLWWVDAEKEAKLKAAGRI